eukprot:TRINITY_DN5588_c0_g1_i2.p1 TRINITY_DN5588_c0_g1~~TRINITY_DN5588_c0_g1_i2.p1  ORF type:complete len:273 (+),score=42.50 TRINITY_DN5588_c0_g1_i2:101-919(+)
MSRPGREAALAESISASDTKSTQPSTKKAKRRKNEITAAQNKQEMCEEAQDGRQRCWGSASSLACNYHDTFWGRPCYDAKELYGSLCLQSFQCGLGWMTVLRKAEATKKAFANWDFNKVAKFGKKDVERLLKNDGIIKHRGKINAMIANAKKVVEYEKSHEGGFVGFVWKHRPTTLKEYELHNGKALTNHMRTDYKTKAEDRLLSDGVHPTASVAKFTKVLKKEGFKFLGETTVLSFFQAVGVMNHHAHDCFAYAECKAMLRSDIKFDDGDY